MASNVSHAVPKVPTTTQVSYSTPLKPLQQNIVHQALGKPKLVSQMPSIDLTKEEQPKIFAETSHIGNTYFFGLTSKLPAADDPTTIIERYKIMKIPSLKHFEALARLNRLVVYALAEVEDGDKVSKKFAFIRDSSKESPKKDKGLHSATVVEAAKGDHILVRPQVVYSQEYFNEALHLGRTKLFPNENTDIKA
jgi:hypothetical protein